jgi:hypothetical protein
MFLAMHGPLITRGSLTGPEQRTLQSALAAGYVTRLLPGVYAVEGSEDDVAVRAAAVVAWHPDAVVTGRAAARLTFWPRLRVTDVEVVRRGHPPRSRGYRFHERTVDPAHIIELPSLCLTTQALTAVDLVDELGGDGIDTCLRARAARLEDLWTAFAAHHAATARRRFPPVQRRKPRSPPPRELSAGEAPAGPRAPSLSRRTGRWAPARAARRTRRRSPYRAGRGRRRGSRGR